MNKQIAFLLQKVDSILLIGLFTLGIFLPLIDNLFDLDPSPQLVEKRLLAEKPIFRWEWRTIKDYPDEFEDYYRDHLGFRDSLILWNNCIHVKWLRTSPTYQVVLGNDDWLFLEGTTIDYYRGTYPFTMTKIARIARILEERRTWLAEHDIPLLYVFTPIKSSIYPEYIPPSINRVNEHTLLDHLIMYLKKYSELEFIDLRGTLLKGKNGEILFHKTGTHWNSYGAYLAYREIITHLSSRYSELKPLQVTDLTFKRETVNGYDLAVMLGLEDVLREEQIFVSPRKPVAQQLNNVPQEKEYYPGRPPFAMETGNPNLPHAVMFRDSFGHYMIPFLSENFRRISYVYQPEFDTQVILQEQPDLVMHQLVERALTEFWVLNPLEISHNYLEERFMSSKDVRFDLETIGDIKTIKLSGNVFVQDSPEKVGLKFPDEESGIMLPVLLKNTTSLLIARMDMYSPAETSLKLTFSNKFQTKWAREIFFRDYIRKLFNIPTPKSKYLLEEESFEVKLKGGRHTYYISIDAKNLTGPVIFQLNPGTNTYDIFDIEIRNVPYPHEMNNT